MRESITHLVSEGKRFFTRISAAKLGVGAMQCIVGVR